MGYLEDKSLNSFVEKPPIWWRYIDDIFMIRQHWEEKLKESLKILSSCHPRIKFTVEYSLDKVNFLDVEVIRCRNNIFINIFILLLYNKIYILNLRILSNTSNFYFVTYIILKNLSHIAMLSVSIGFVP